VLRLAVSHTVLAHLQGQPEAHVSEKGDGVILHVDTDLSELVSCTLYDLLFHLVSCLPVHPEMVTSYLFLFA
jgi:hypothetical protein